MVPDTKSETTKWVDLSLRDGQQSTLDSADWVFEARGWVKALLSAQSAGAAGAEIAGGQSFQTAIRRGYNPFRLVGTINQALHSSKQGCQLSLQMLFRGANALGFRHYDKDVLEFTLKEFIKEGINKIRFFDALNDIENLELPESIRSNKDLILEGAFCFVHYPEAPERYNDEYYCNYSKILLAAGYNAIAIKDMSGQLTEKRVATLLPALQEILAPQNIPLTLHCHSTNALRSQAAIKKAIELGVDRIETVEGPLAGGSAHHPLAEVFPEQAESPQYAKHQSSLQSLWGRAPKRQDHQIDDPLKEQLCAAGVPGGAMPFVISDLQQQVTAILAKYDATDDATKAKLSSLPCKREDGFPFIVALFLNELKRVCIDAALPLLVTPTADICCKQAITNLAIGAEPFSDDLAGRYLNRNGQPNPDIRFAKLILGYYGELKEYDAESRVHSPSSQVLEFFKNHNAQQLDICAEHPSRRPKGNDLREAQQATWQLIQKLGARALSFASFDQLSILYALKPTTAAASDDPIEQAVNIYLKRSESAKIDGRGSTFTGYETLMQPILSYLGAQEVVTENISVEQILNQKLSTLGEGIYKHLYDVYVDLPIWSGGTILQSHLSKLLTSEQVAGELKNAARNVSDSLIELDLRPRRQEKTQMEEALKKFSQLTIADLFNSLAMIQSFVNDVAKYATNPKIYASRCLKIEDMQRLNKRLNKENFNDPWIQRIQRSITGKYIRLQTDMQHRIQVWKSSFAL
ncbi:MAG: hypothetical protein ACK5NG_00950 [Chthoniobacterales bacterium]